MSNEKLVELLLAALGAVTVLAGAMAAVMVRRRRAPAAREAPPPLAPRVHECVVSAEEIGQLRQAVETLAGEVQGLRHWRHEVATDIGAARMVARLMRSVNELRVRVARIEGKRGGGA